MACIEQRLLSHVCALSRHFMRAALGTTISSNLLLPSCAVLCYTVLRLSGVTGTSSGVSSSGGKLKVSHNPLDCLESLLHCPLYL